MKQVISRYPLVSYFTMAFLFAWIAVLPLLRDRSLPIEPFQILGALAGPTLAAVIVVAATHGRDGLGTFFKRYVQWRAGVVWWLVVLLGILVALTITAILILGTSVATAFVQNIGLLLPTYLVNLLAGIILGPLWEEPGWRGVALPRLQTRFGPLAGSLILGVLWALWHLPGFLGGWLPPGSFWALVVSTTAFSIIITWVYNNTRGSLLLMILFHSSSSAAISLGPMLLPANLSGTMSVLVNGAWIPAIAYTFIAIGLVLSTRGRLSYEQGSRAEPMPYQETIDPGAMSPTTGSQAGLR